MLDDKQAYALALSNQDLISQSAFEITLTVENDLVEAESAWAAPANASAKRARAVRRDAAGWRRELQRLALEDEEDEQREVKSAPVGPPVPGKLIKRAREVERLAEERVKKAQGLKKGLRFVV